MAEKDSFAARSVDYHAELVAAQQEISRVKAVNDGVSSVLSAIPSFSGVLTSAECPGCRAWHRNELWML